MARHRHHRTGTICGDDEITDPDGHLFTGQRIGGKTTGRNPDLLLQHAALEVGQRHHLVAHGSPFFFELASRHQFFSQWVLGGEGEEGDTEYRVGASGESGDDLIIAINLAGGRSGLVGRCGDEREANHRSFGTPYPIALQRLDVLRIVDIL